MTKQCLRQTQSRIRGKPSQIRINMQLELLIRSIRRSVLELRAVQLKGQWSRCIDALLAGEQWDMEAEYGVLFRDGWVGLS